MATKNQEAVLALVVKDIKKGRKVSVSRSIRETGLYSPSYAKEPQKLTASKGWNDLVKQYLPDSFLNQRHRKLFDQKKVEYFSFNLKKSDEEIKAAVEDAGLELINISHTTDSKLAWYSVDDVHAVTKALEMAHKIKGVYLADRTTTPEVVINHNLFYSPTFQQTLREFEEKAKTAIENAKPIQEN